MGILANVLLTVINNRTPQHKNIFDILVIEKTDFPFATSGLRHFSTQNKYIQGSNLMGNTR